METGWQIRAAETKADAAEEETHMAEEQNQATQAEAAMNAQRTPDEQVSQTKVEWPQSKGDPIYPCWSYAKKKGMYEAEALRMMAHDLVQRLRELELPLHKAMKEAAGDGLTEMAYIKMMTQRLNSSERENYRLRKQIERLASEVQTLQERT